MNAEQLKDCIVEYIEQNHPNKKITQYDVNQIWLGMDMHIEDELKDK